MSRIIDIAARFVAKQTGRAVPIRETSALCGDPERTFGIGFVKIVSEEIVQAIAFGQLGAAPRIVARWNPLSRDSNDLDEFASALDSYLTSTVSAGLLPRIWLPHTSALTLLELLGHRYRTNTMASVRLRRMGWQCRALAVEAKMPGQQVVAVAADLLRTHFVSGQAPVKDGHLGAMLAWMSPAPGIDPAIEADRRALRPASGVLERRDDEDVERLRKVAKRGNERVRQRAVERIIATLEAGATEEWQNLNAARDAFWSRGLTQAPGTGELARRSLDRVRFALSEDRSPASRPHSLARELEAQERAAELLEETEFCGDSRLRERARGKGRAVGGEIVRVVQPRSSRRPCTVYLRTDQEVLRIRAGTLLQRSDGRVIGRVEDVTEEPDGRRVVRMDLTKGVRKSERPAEGSVSDWVDAVPHDASFTMSKVYRRMRDTAHPLVYEQRTARGEAVVPPAVDLFAVAQRLRRPR